MIDKRFVYFFYVGEELNMTRAAEKAFVSRQAISSAIKSLESEYGNQLLVRAPRLRLTVQGETLMFALRQMKVIEDNLSVTIKHRNYNFYGEISMGILESRYEIIMPDIVSEFNALYKNVQLKVVNTYSYDLEQRIKNNELDMIITPVIIYHPDIIIKHIIDEKFVLLISNAMLHKYFPGITKADILKFRDGVELKKFAGLPIISYPQYTRFEQAVINYETKNKFKFHRVFESNHAISFNCFVKKNVGLAIVPSLFLNRIAIQNSKSDVEEYVNAFPINDLDYTGELSLAYRKNRYFSRCHYDLIDLIFKVFKQYGNLMPDYL